jgi:hypothetical protein
MKTNFLALLGIIFGSIFFFVWSTWAGDLILEKPLTGGSYSTTGSLIARSNCIVPSGVKVSFEAYNNIILQGNFRVSAGASLRVHIPDNDGLPNAWEMKHFGHLNWGPDDDPDGDLQSNATELRLGTNPMVMNLDNDGDGLPDWWEVSFFGDLSQGPTSDSDRDGYDNKTEFLVGTNPADARDAPVPAGNFFNYDAFGRIILKQITLEPE